MFILRALQLKTNNNKLVLIQAHYFHLLKKKIITYTIKLN